MENLTNCPICNATSSHLFLRCKDNTVSRETFTIVECDICGFRYTNPRPEAESLGKYYESEDYVSHSNTSKGFVNWLYQKVRKSTLKRKLRLISSFTSKGSSLLDVGCGTGEFLNVCKRAGWNVIGVEPSEEARKQGQQNFGLEVKNESSLKQLEKESFDVITLWHVLEHVPLLKERVLELKQLLKPNGTLLVAVPNCSSRDALHYKQFWAAYDLPRHLYHFRPRDIEMLFGDQSMRVVETLPMMYDAYYVSMLSEKYKSGAPSLLNALWNGWKSNRSASYSPQTFSSLIYVIRNK
jgi:2-polyprenyl-3-methyl-5-hydroxy-6-metoxy-1,4-benzoquinol methylase